MKYPVNLLVNQMLICYCCSKIFEFAAFFDDLLATVTMNMPFLVLGCKLVLVFCLLMQINTSGSI
jgi:hypothetical protein